MSLKVWTAGEKLNATDLNDAFLATPNVKLVASGSLSDGSKVVLNSDGTVSVITGVNVSNGSPASGGFSGSSSAQTGCYDPASGKVIVAGQKDGAGSGGGTCSVGTITGTSISFGAPVTFFASWMGTCTCVPIGSSKILFAYCDYNTGQQGQMIVGTISGTTISFGSAVTFNAGASVNSYIGLDWDSTNSKALLTYKNATTDVRASVVTVSGTTITINTSVQIASVSSSMCRTKWTGTSNVFFTIYNDVTNSVPKGVVCTVSGTSVTFGTPVTYAGAISTHDLWWDATDSKAVIAYQLTSDTKGYAIIGSISGTVASYGTAVKFCDTATSSISITYDTTNSKVVIVYYDATVTKAIAGNVSGTTITFPYSSFTVNASNIATASGGLWFVSSGKCYGAISPGYAGGIMFTTSYSNLTSTNFLGCSQGAWANGETASIGIIGCKNATQTGLTIGTKYYIENDGTLSTTNTLPYFGIAISTTAVLLRA